MLSLLKLSLLAGVQRDAEGIGEGRAQFLQVWDPVADTVDVERLARDHLGLEAVLLGFFECTGELEHLTEREVGFDRRHDFLDDGRQLRDDGRRGDFVHAGLHEFLLTLDAPNVALFVAVAHIGDSSLAVHVLHARLEVDEQAAVVIPGVFVVHAFLDVDINAADGIDDFLEGLDVDDDVMVHVDAEEVFNGALRELLAGLRAALGTAVGVGRIDFIPAMALDFDARIARDGHQGGLVLLRVKCGNHQCVAAANIIIALIYAHDHDGRFILGRQQAILHNVVSRFVEQAVRGKESTRCRRGNKG